VSGETPEIARATHAFPLVPLNLRIIEAYSCFFASKVLCRVNERRSRKDPIANRLQPGVAGGGEILERLDIGAKGRPAVQHLKAFDRNHASEGDMVSILQRAVAGFLVEAPRERKPIKCREIFCGRS